MKKRIQFGCAFFVYAFKRFEVPFIGMVLRLWFPLGCYWVDTD